MKDNLITVEILNLCGEQKQAYALWSRPRALESFLNSAALDSEDPLCTGYPLRPFYLNHVHPAEILTRPQPCRINRGRPDHTRLFCVRHRLQLCKVKVIWGKLSTALYYTLMVIIDQKCGDCSR